MLNISAAPDEGGSTALQSARSDPACQAALAKACPGLAHKGPTCHACTIARQKTLGPPSGPCSFVGDPPPDIQEYCRGRRRLAETSWGLPSVRHVFRCGVLAYSRCRDSPSGPRL